MFFNFKKKQAVRKEQTEVAVPKKVFTDVSDCIMSDNPSVSLKVMTIADMHGHLSQTELFDVFCANPKPDMVILLGDNFPHDLNGILSVIPEPIQVYGIEGNHDKKGLLQEYPRIIPLDKTVIQGSNYTMAGLSGSIKYKPDDYYNLITTEESRKALGKLPVVDILITHDKPCFKLPDEFLDFPDAHTGLFGIGEYIETKHPKIVLHGHLHTLSIKKYEDTVIRCCYGIEIFDIAF